MTLLIDSAEPAAIERLISQSVEVARVNLNVTSRADYYWAGEDGRTEQYCRVQAAELLSGIDSQEDELRRYYESADQTNLVMEGIISSVPLTARKERSLADVTVRKASRPNTLFSYKIADSGFIYDERVWDASVGKYHGWLIGLDRVGVRTYNTMNWIETAKFLSTAYNNAQKAEHQTLNRYYRPRISIQSQDPFVKMLMGMSLAYELNIGEEKAKVLASRFHNIVGICLADVSEIMQCAGVGKVIANKLLDAIGRES
jgi:hypothetical protein